VPMWIITMLVLWYIQRQYLTSIVIYREVEEQVNEKGKVIGRTKAKPTQVYRYDWNSSDARTALGVVTYAVMIIVTLVTVCIVLT
jgi:hypothetical protein